MTPPAPLKLIALDADDLAVISAHVQDARVQAADIIWRQDEKRLVIGMSRLDWEQMLSGEPASRRLIAALRFDRVLACKSRRIDLEAQDTPLELVGIEFHQGDPPGGSAPPWRRAGWPLVRRDDGLSKTSRVDGHYPPRH